MAKREALVELVRKKDDLENMLASLETAYREASISEEHYKEMKEKNQKKLDEIKEKIKKKGGAEEMPEVPLSTPEPEEEVPVSTPGPEVPEKAEKEIKLEGAPENLNEALSKIVNELKSDKGLAERFEKFQVELEKLKTMMDAKKDEKSLMEERLQRVIEEVGEIRSSTSSMEGRLSEQEMKMEELKEIIDFLKPERFTKDLQKKDAELKSHEDKIERLDETMSMILKNINAIKNVLERMGSIENIARMSNEISKKLIEIDEKSKKMTRVADRIDNIFVELNKRMEEFLFYKAKQDALDALSKETLKSIDEINMKLENFAQRSELEDLRAVMGGGQSEVSAPVEEETSEPDEITKLKFQKQEIKDFLNMLDEQHKGGEINEKDYQQAKKTNTEKIKKIERQIAEKSGAAAPVETEKPSEKEEASEEKTENPPETKEKTQKPSEKKETQKPIEKKEAMEEKPKKPIESKEVKKPPKKEEVKKPKEIKAKPEPTEKEKETKEPEEEPEKKLGKRERMLLELEESFKKGLISKRTYERTKKILLK